MWVTVVGVAVDVLPKLCAARLRQLAQVVACQRILRNSDLLVDVLLREVVGDPCCLQTQRLEGGRDVVAVLRPQAMFE